MPPTATFCDGKGDPGAHAKSYPASGKRNCEVKLLKDRFGGKFIASGNPLLVVNYESGCEARANDDGGAVVFELIKASTASSDFSRRRGSTTASWCRAVRGRTRQVVTPRVAGTKAAYRRIRIECKGAETRQLAQRRNGSLSRVSRQGTSLRTSYSYAATRVQGLNTKPGVIATSAGIGCRSENRSG